MSPTAKVATAYGPVKRKPPTAVASARYTVKTHSASTASITCVPVVDVMRTVVASGAVAVIVPSDDCAAEFSVLSSFKQSATIWPVTTVPSENL